MTMRDPLELFFQIKRRAIGASQPYEGGEHVWLGNEGARRAVAARHLPNFGPFKRKTSPEALTYGEIVAFSGDFYETPDDLYGETPATLPWLYEENDLSDLRDALRNELSWIDQPPSARGSDYPDENIVLWWNAKRYVELGLKNTSHFGWHNALMYVQWHETALMLVAQAAKADDMATRSQQFAQAVYTNAFADHFLTDGFAAGHVRSPAAQLRTWATAQAFDEKMASVLLKLIHDQDGHVDEIHGQQEHGSANEGLRVTNARGDDWRARCDGQLFLVGPADAAVEHAVSAVSESVGECLDVYNGAPIPAGVFAAGRWLPWTHPDERALVDKFPANLDDAGALRLWNGLRWYLKVPGLSAGIKPSHIQQLFRALPGIVDAFRRDVAADAAGSPFVTRLPSAFVDAYKAVR